MPGNDDDLNDYEVCFTVAPDPRPKPITRIAPDRIFFGGPAVDVVFKVRAADAEEAEEKAYELLTGPDYIKRFGQGFEVKTKYVWQIMHF